jgi:DNA end-binding protein Ku
MAKPVWEGHLRLSLVTCPVALYKATDPKGDVAFHLINPKTKSRIVQVVKDATTGQELDRTTLVRGFEVARDQYVLIDPEELKALRIESTRVLDLERFVDAATIDRIYWDEPYYLAPSEKTGTEAFAVILEAMRDKKRVGIGRLVLNTRERICALEPSDNCLLLTTLRTHEDIVTASDVGGIAKLPKPDRGMLDIAETIIEQHKGTFDPLTFTDRYEDAVRDLIARKQKGRKVTTAPPVARAEGHVVDLMDALRRSLAGQGGGSKERAERFLERTKGKAVPKAKPKKTTAASRSHRGAA